MKPTVTAENNESLHTLLVQIWKGDKMRRQNVIGPDGVNYKVYTPDDDTVVFAPQSGIDAEYGQISTKGLAGE